MEVIPQVVLQDAMAAANPDLSKAGTALADALVEGLDSKHHYAEFEIVVTGRIIDPQSGDTVCEAERKLPYTVHWDRNPKTADPTE